LDHWVFVAILNYASMYTDELDYPVKKELGEPACLVEVPKLLHLGLALEL